MKSPCVCPLSIASLGREHRNASPTILFLSFSPFLAPLFFTTSVCEPVWGRRVCVCVFRRLKKIFLLSASDVTNLL